MMLRSLNFIVYFRKSLCTIQGTAPTEKNIKIKKKNNHVAVGW